MHQETKKLTQKHALSNTDRKFKATTISPGSVASYDIQPGNGVGLFWDNHIHIYLLTYLPRTYTGQCRTERISKFINIVAYNNARFHKL